MAKRGGSGGGGSGGGIVLILFLVFFILLSIGLGVTTYLGFSAEDDKAGKNKKLGIELSAMEKERDWYRFQSDLYRSYMGHTQNLDFENLAVARGKFDAGTLTGPGKDEVKMLVTTVLDKKMAWNAAQKRPNVNYEQLLADANRKTELADGANKDAQAAIATAQAATKAVQDQLAEANKAHEAQFADLKARSQKELDRFFAENVKLQDQLNNENKTFTDKLNAVAETKIGSEKLLKAKDTVIADLRKELKRKDDQIDLLKKTAGTEIATGLKKDWKIMRIDGRGETAVINLGSADSVQTGLTFRVHGLQRDGEPAPKDKATVQVLNVLADHLSQVKILYSTEIPVDKEGRSLPPRHDPRNNPVLKGDIVVNPSWYPNQKKHIAIAGIVDVTGDGRDDTEQFVREMERHNIIVDAYLDLRKDFTIKGPGISVQTDFLIIGETPDAVVGAQGREKEIREKINNAMDTMQRQARESGVKMKSLHSFLEDIGYRVPGNQDRKKPTLEIKSDAGGLPPAVPKNPGPAPAPAPMPMQ